MADLSPSGPYAPILRVLRGSWAPAEANTHNYSHNSRRHTLHTENWQKAGMNSHSGFIFETYYFRVSQWCLLWRQDPFSSRSCNDLLVQTWQVTYAQTLTDHPHPYNPTQKIHTDTHTGKHTQSVCHGGCGVWGVCVMKEKANEWKRKRVKEEKKKEEGLCECVSAKMLPFTLPI